MIIAAIAGYFIKDEEENTTYATPFIAVALIISLFIFNPYESATDSYSSTHLYSIGGHSISISGDFYLGSGVIETNQVYIGEIKKDGGYMQYLIPTKDTVKIEKDINHAIFKEQQCIRKSFFMRKFLKNHSKFHKSSKLEKCVSHEAKRFLYVPKGTIIKQFNL